MENRERCKYCGCFLAFENCDTQFGDFSDFYCNNPKCPENIKAEQDEKAFAEAFENKEVNLK